MKRKKIIMIGGLPGSGKSYLAKALVEVINAIHLSSDKVRKELSKSGKYANSDKQLVYDKLMAMLEDYIKNSSTVIIDTTFQKKETRTRVKNIAEKINAELYFIVTTASDEVVQMRTSKKREDSEADYEVYRLLKNQFDPITTDHLEINTDNISRQELIDIVLGYCGIQHD